MNGFWCLLKDRFHKRPKRLEIARKIVLNGLRLTENGEIYLGDLRVPFSSLAEAVHVDRRTVISTVNEILSDPYLSRIFKAIRPAGPSIQELSDVLGLGYIEVYVDDPSASGIISNVTSILANEGIAIRQLIAEDPYVSPNPKLIIITKERVLGDIISKISGIPAVRRVVIQ